MAFYTPRTLITVYSVLAGIGLVITAVRFWVRAVHTRISFGLDDLFMALGVAVVSACTAMQYYNAIHGAGGEAISNAEGREKSIIASRQMDWSMIVVEKPAFGFLKLSILFFYRRIFGIWPEFRRISDGLVVFLTAWALSFTIADVLVCGSHPELQWGFDQTITRARCGNKAILLLSFAVTSVLTDCILLVLPFFYLGRLQMARSKKMGSGFVLLLGTASTAASVLRLIFLCVAYPMGRLAFGYSPPANDQTPLILQVFNPTFWIMVEMWLAVWAANLPPCAPLLRSFHPYQTLSNLYWKATSAFSSRSAMTEKQRLPSHDDGRPLNKKSRNGSEPRGRKISDVPPSLQEFKWDATGQLSVVARNSSEETPLRG